MILLIIIMNVVCYLCYAAWVTGGIPESLSATYYNLKGDGWLFQALMVFCGIGLLPSWMDVSSDDWQFLVFLSCAGIVFTGVAPAFKLKLEGAVHYSAAVVCCVSAIVWILLEGMYPVVLWWGLIGWMLYLQYGRWCWWLEVAVIGGILTSLI